MLLNLYSREDKPMSDKQEAVTIFPSHVEAEAAVLELQKAGFDVQKISIIGKDYQTSEHVRGFLTWKDTAKAGAGEAGYWGSFFGGLFGILTGVGLLFIPGVGPVIVAGHAAGVLAGWIEGMIVGGVGAAVAGGLVGALVGLGIPQEQALKYETEIKAGKFMVIVSGTDEEMDRAQQILQNAGHEVPQPVIA
jgi:outer membrane lipoprotein SlyB